jgi:hypothetical protein
MPNDAPISGIRTGPTQINQDSAVRVVNTYASARDIARAAANEITATALDEVNVINARGAVEKYDNRVPRRWDFPRGNPYIRTLGNPLAGIKDVDIDGSGLAAQNDSDIFIELPVMPDTVELAREAVFNNRVTTPLFPDGIHIYEHTTPVEIPVKFSLHAFDRYYCTDGPITLLTLAARMHAMTLPVQSVQLSKTQQEDAKGNAVNANAPSDKGSEESQKKKADDVKDVYFDAEGKKLDEFNISWPPVCVLSLIRAGAHGPGVNCAGFVRSVRVTLRGPWLRLRNSSEYSNLPTSADYEFVFVHSPGYVNRLSYVEGDLMPQMAVQLFGPEVKGLLYNSRPITSVRGVSTPQGFSSRPVNKLPAT